MADENTAVVADEELQPEEGAVVEEEQRELTASEIAAELGWKPKDQWQGDPEAWKPADEFIRTGREIQQTTSRELRAMREQVERLTSTSSQILADQLAKRDAEWQAKFTQAVEDGDTATATRLAEQRPQPPAQQGEDPAVTSWKAANPWFESHPDASFLAAGISQRMATRPVMEQLEAAEKEVRKRFPELFGTPAKPPPATQTAASRNPNPSNRAKGFADMPQESQRMALEYEKDGVSKEDFAKSYWADDARRSVRA